MSWKTEARAVRQAEYGYYRLMCSELNIQPVPFHEFDRAEYNRVKELRKNLARVRLN
jgi:hypothetical protein